MFALIVKSKKVGSMTEAGSEFIVRACDQGCVPATSSLLLMTDQVLPKDTMLWPTEEKAEEFARNWEGHPYWCRPNGKFRVVAVTPKYVQVHDGFLIKGSDPETEGTE